MMNKLIRLLGIVAAIAVLGLVLAYLAGLFHAKIDSDALPAETAESSGSFVAVEAVREPVFEQATGTVRAKDETIISSRVTATISKVNVRAGDRVAVGDPLIELDAREASARLAQQRQVVSAAQARLTQARREYQRARNIFSASPEAISQAAVDAAEAALRAAEAETSRAKRGVEEATTASSYANIDAPIDGTIVERYADPGDTAIPGKPLLRLYNPRLLRLEANVRETLVSRLKLGDELEVHIDALDAEFLAKVEEIVPSADPGSRSFLVKLTLPENDALYPGMFGRLRIPSAEVERYYVPAAAVRRMGQLEFVVARTESGAVRRYVRTGERRADGRVQILTGLEPADQVAVPE